MAGDRLILFPQNPYLRVFSFDPSVVPTNGAKGALGIVTSTAPPRLLQKQTTGIGIDWAGLTAGSMSISTFGTRAAPLNIVAGTGLSPLTGQSTFNQAYIQGSAGAVVVVAAPAIAAGTQVGEYLMIEGRSDVNTVTFNHTGANGISINGAITLSADSFIILSWDGTNWVEAARSA